MSSSPFQPKSPLRGPALTLRINEGNSIIRPTTPGPSCYTPTPSSTTVECGEGLPMTISAAEKANMIFGSWLSSDRLGQSAFDAEASSPVIRKPRPVNTKLITERMGGYLQNLGQATGDPNKQLVQENHGLHQRIATLRRSEGHLLKDNQELLAALANLQDNQEIQKRQIEIVLQKEHEQLQKRIQELEKHVLQQNDRIFKLTYQAKIAADAFLPSVSTISDAEITSWFLTRGNSWAAWVDEFAHKNPNRMTSLHHLQQKEILDSIDNFVHLTPDKRLPEPLASPGVGTSVSINTTRALLQGMLSDFIVSETLASPFWIFAALSNQGFDIESPTLPRGGGMTVPSAATPAGFRMDATWPGSGGSAPPPPCEMPPTPTTGRPMDLPSPGRGPSHLTALPGVTRGLSLQYDLPGKSQVEDLLTLLMKTQKSNNRVLHWRAQLIQMFSEAGLSSSPTSLDDNNEDRQMLVNARREYAQQLKERFLGSTARYFLDEQDAQGIARLEAQLMIELDLALRFSVRIWARTTPVHFIGLQEMVGPGPAQTVRLDDEVMTLCRAQQQEADPVEGVVGREVVMVLQPAVGTLRSLGSSGAVWVKSEVVAAAKGEKKLAMPPSSLVVPPSPASVFSVPIVLAASTYKSAERGRVSTLGIPKPISV